jgi:guanylate kinase
MTKVGKLVVIAGPSGVGKGTLAKFLVDNFPKFHLSVSATTRPARSGEVDGVSYFFVSESEFAEKVSSGQMLEWATVHGQHSYGTPRAAVQEALEKGLSVLLEIDVQGAFQVKEVFPDAVLVFVKPPSFEELRNRLDKRGTESEQEKLVRLQTAEVELEQAGAFDFVVINDEVARCAQEVVDLTQST